MNTSSPASTSSHASRLTESGSSSRRARIQCLQQQFNRRIESELSTLGSENMHDSVDIVDLTEDSGPSLDAQKDLVSGLVHRCLKPFLS